MFAWYYVLTPENRGLYTKERPNAKTCIPKGTHKNRRPIFTSST